MGRCLKSFESFLINTGRLEEMKSNYLELAGMTTTGLIVSV